MKASNNGHGGKAGGHVTETPDVSHIKNIDVTHEVSDVDLRGIIGFLIGLSVMTVVVYVLMLLMFNVLNSREEKKEADNRPMALSERERLPPEPRLQSAPGFAEDLAKQAGVKEVDDLTKPRDRTWEMEQLRKKWDDELLHGAKDPSGKPVALPIDEAKKLLLTSGALPVRTTTPAPGGPDYGIDMPTAASSGRMTEKRKQ